MNEEIHPDREKMNSKLILFKGNITIHTLRGCPVLGGIGMSRNSSFGTRFPVTAVLIRHDQLYLTLSRWGRAFGRTVEPLRWLLADATKNLSQSPGARIRHRITCFSRSGMMEGNRSIITSFSGEHRQRSRRMNNSSTDSIDLTNWERLENHTRERYNSFGTMRDLESHM